MPDVGYVFDPLYLDHGMPNHPEDPERLRAVVAHLEESGLLEGMARVEPRDAAVDELELVHTRDLVSIVRSAAKDGGGWLDPDTYVVGASYDAALRSAGGVLAATEDVLDGRLRSAFCLVRPPGHHATPTRAMGFCLFNNVAVAAAEALERRGLERVAIVDFDVHHGNGTQDAFYSDPRVLYFSTHQYPYYPGTGNWSDTGAGTTVNVPLPHGCGDEEYLRVYEEVALPALHRFRPQLLLVSAGFDAHFEDPLAGMNVSTRGYYEIASMLKAAADECCGGRIVYALEGGYDHRALAWSVRACIDTLLGNRFMIDPVGVSPDSTAPDIDGLLSDIKRLHRLD